MQTLLSLRNASVGRLLLSGVAVILTLVVIEIGLRVFDYGSEFPDALPPKYVRVYDPWRGFYLQPNQLIRWTSTCFDVQGIETNSFGMRDRERVIEKSGPRVALLGDSFMRAFEVGNNHVINRVLEDEFPSVEFLNFGESGHGTIQAFQTYDKFAYQFEPDIVIYFMYANDVSDDHYQLRAWRGAKPGAVLPGGDNYPDYVKVDGEWEFVTPTDQYSGPTGILALKTWLGRHVRIYLFGRHIRDAIVLFRTQSTSGVQTISSEGPIFFPAAEGTEISTPWMHLLALAPPQNKYWNEAWEITLYSLQILAESVSATGAQFVVVGIPDADVFRIQESSFETVTGEAAPDGFDPNYYYDVIGGFLTEQQIPFLNLQQLYPEYVVDPMSLYHECNFHWNEAGHRVTAELVADFLRRDIAVLAGQ